MLFLPAFRFDDHEFRLPSSAGDLVDLCVAINEPILDTDNVESLLSRNPGLLIFCLHRYWRLEQGAAVSMRHLAEFLPSGFFATEIECDALAPAGTGVVDQQRLIKYAAKKPTRKRLLRFLTTTAGVGYPTADKLLATILCPGFRQWFAGEAGAFPKKLSAEVVVASAGHGVQRLPARGIWLVCANLQRLKQGFGTELQRQKLQAMKQLAYGASHEINNPLANIATRAQSLMAEETNPSRRQRLSVVYAQAIRAHEMISDMMLFAHPPELQPECVEPRRLVSMVIAELKQQLDEAGIVVRVHQYPKVPICELDRTQVAVALKAILQNAIHATGRQGEIRIQIWRGSEHEWAMSVADSGAGIEPQIADQIFDPFFSGREAGRGLGFGLSKVWRIVDLHGGRIALDPRHCGGARFVMRFPIQQSSPANCETSRIDNGQAA